MARIHFLDVTNRDGVQTARTGLSKFGKTMVNFYLGKLGVAQSEIGFPFLFHEVPYIRAQLALAAAGAFGEACEPNQRLSGEAGEPNHERSGDTGEPNHGRSGGLRLSGWCRAVVADVEKSVALGLEHYNLSISTSDQMLARKFRGKLDRDAVIRETVQAVRTARDGGAKTIGVNAEDGSRTDDGFLIEFALAAKEAGADRLRYCDTIGGDSPGRIGNRFARLASAVAMPVETHCHNDLGMAVANSVAGALGDLAAGQDAWINTCINGIGERSGNADLLSCILAATHAFGVACEPNQKDSGVACEPNQKDRGVACEPNQKDSGVAYEPNQKHDGLACEPNREHGDVAAEIGDPLDLSWARRFARWAAYAFGQPLPHHQPGVGHNAFAHESGIHADGALKDHRNYELYDENTLGPFPADWHTRQGRTVLTGEYGGKAGFHHVMDGLGIEVTDEELTFRLVQLCNAATGRPLTDDELRLIAAYPRQLALLYPGQLD